MLAKLLTAVRLVGIRGVLQSVHYPILQWLIERRFKAPPASGEAVAPGTLASAESMPGGARFRFDGLRTDPAELEVVFLAPDLARVTWGPATLLPPYALARTEWPEVSVARTEQSDGWALSTDALRVHVQRDGALRFFDASGVLLRDDLPPLRREGETTLRSRLRQGACVYGLGNRTTGLNLRGRTFTMWNRDPGAGHRPGDDPIYLCLPVYTAVHAEGSHLAFHENSHRATFTFTDPAAMRFDGGALRYYVIPGPPSRAIERYTDLTGRPPLPPRWALGYHQSRWSYETEAEVREVADGFRAHDLPLSVIHLDIDFMHGFRVFTADRSRFPDLAALSRDLHDRGIRLVAIVDPGVKQDDGYDVFTSGAADRVFCALPDGALATAPVWPGWCAFPDFTDPKARAWWGQFYPRLLDLGIAGFWHDMNEPATFAAWGDPTLPRPTRHAMDGRGGDHLEAHNLYGLLENRAGYEALRALRPEQRPFIVSRSGWAGGQRYAWNWTGDVETSWQALRRTVATVLGLGLSGIPFTGPDVGGFSGEPSAELYVRWLQFAAFLPFFRTHSIKTAARREPWRFGEPVLGIAREVLRLRYRLLPYLYTLVWEATQTGHPPVRPLFWPDARDRALWDVQDAFLLGDALLVAPVLEDGARSRDVALPAGTWHEMSNDRAHRGSGRISIGAPLERIPVLVRAGTVLPMEEPHTRDGGMRLVLHAYPPEDGEGGGRLYSDSGDGYGPGRVDSFRLRREDGGLRLLWTGEGQYPPPHGSVEVQFHGMTIRRARVDGVDVRCDANRIRTRPFKEALVEP